MKTRKAFAAMVLAAFSLWIATAFAQSGTPSGTVQVAPGKYRIAGATFHTDHSNHPCPPKATALHTVRSFPLKRESGVHNGKLGPAFAGQKSHTKR